MDSSMILFLNKKDLFAEKIIEVSLKIAFESYTGETLFVFTFLIFISLVSSSLQFKFDVRDLYLKARKVIRVSADKNVIEVEEVEKMQSQAQCRKL